MNFLAHAYLSFGNPAILTGNLISDFVKGKKQYEYPADIQKGIALHRAIDMFTDQHLATKTIREIFKNDYGLYAGAFTDIAYDYFLANDQNEFPGETLLSFTISAYNTVEARLPETPPIFQQIFPSMKLNNWLYNYRLDEGINRSFYGLVNRARYMHDHERAFSIFASNKQLIASQYRLFFPDLKQQAMKIFEQLLKSDQYL